jgi:hypothetical protein
MAGKLGIASYTCTNFVEEKHGAQVTIEQATNYLE